MTFPFTTHKLEKSWKQILVLRIRVYMFIVNLLSLFGQNKLNSFFLQTLKYNVNIIILGLSKVYGFGLEPSLCLASL